MKTASMISRILLGLVFFVFGLNQFLHFIPMPPPSGPAGEFGMAMYNTKYFIPFLGFFQTLCGLLLLINRFVPLALIVLFPINLNIVLFHLFLDPAGIGFGLVLMILNIFLLYAYRSHYAHFQNAKAGH